MTRPSDRVAVTGLGMVSALGAGASTGFRRLIAGDRGIGPVTLFDTAGLRSTIAGEARDFQPEAARRSGEALSRTDALALFAAREALGSAALDPRGAGLGFAIGGTTGSMLETEAELAERPRGGVGADRARRLLSHPLSTTVRVLEAELAPFCRTATVCSACSSGAIALIQAAHWLLHGEASAVLAGGADALCRMTFSGFNALGAVDPAPCRPFDAARAGLSLGEGAAFLVLELESRARVRGVRPLAFLSGWALGAEAHHMTHPEASGARAARLIEDALAGAGLGPEAVDYVNAHGTATLQNDAMEAAALRRVFGDRVSSVRVSSNKGQIGHGLGAAGALEAAITVLALEAGVVPATGGLTQPEAADLRHVIGASERAPIAVAVSNSFGFGGMDAVLVLEGAGAAPRPRPSPNRALVVSGAAALAGEVAIDAECAAWFDGAALAPRAGWDPIAELAPERSRRFDRATALVARSVERALAAAELAPASAGLVVGSAYGPVERSIRFLDRVVAQGPRAATPAEFPHLVQSAAAGNASIYLGIEGPVLTAIDGALSAESALARARSLLELGLGDAVVAGAIEALDPFVAELGALELGGRSIARGEGGAFLVLETLEHARARGKAVLARLDAHVEQRGAAPAECAELAPPRDAASARVVLAALDGSLAALLARSGWAAVPRVELRDHVGHHEAVGGVALAVGAALVRRGASEVLVLSGSEAVRYVTRFSSPERAA